MEILIVTGPPYCGKGTQCKLLVKEYGYKHISTGEIIRSEKAKKSKAGQVMGKYEEQGELVPDKFIEDIVNQIFDENLKEEGIILDGFPRTKAQVDFLVATLRPRNLKVTEVININLPKDELLQRARKRSKTSGRDDDRDENIHNKRVAIYEMETRAAIEHMRRFFLVCDIHGIGTVAETSNKIKSEIKKCSVNF